MDLKRTDSYSNSAGHIGANQYSSETWAGKLGDKCFTVTLNSTAAPNWDGDELTWDERTEVMNELSELSDL